jgi:DNA-3-methyladenine glycosylase
MRKRLGRAFFATDAESLARALLGMRLVRVMDDGSAIRVRINETEAYLGVEDQASHAFGGRRTARTEPMFGPPGLSYVYFTYGMHHCFNVVAGEVDEPAAVLIRGGIVIEGLEAALANRGWTAAKHAANPAALADGPAKLCRALAIDRGLNAIDLTTDARLHLEAAEGGSEDETSVIRTPRIGVDYAGAWASRPLRFVERGATVKLGKVAADSVGELARTPRKGA